MTKVVKINSKGTLTLPQEFRARLGVESAGRSIVAEEIEGGILLRPAATFPVEVYSEERLQEFSRNNEEALAPFVRT